MGTQVVCDSWRPFGSVISTGGHRPEWRDVDKRGDRSMREKAFWVYIMASRSRTLYVGVTSAIERRVWQHKNGVFDGFSDRYQCHRVVYLERYATAAVAIGREKQLKRWSRIKKLALVVKENPAWADLSEEWGKPLPLVQPQTADLSAALNSGRDDGSSAGNS